jgi:hypothetical protein
MSNATPLDDGQGLHIFADGIPSRRRTAAIALALAPDFPACQVFFDHVHENP